MTTSLVAFISSQSNPVCLLSLHWGIKQQQLRQSFCFGKKKYLCVFMSCSKWDVLCMFCAHHPCIRYQHTIIICTLLHRAHGVCTYTVILCHVWLLLFFFCFFYTCACVRFLLCQQTMKQLTCIIKLIGCVFFRVRVHVRARVMSCEFFHSSSLCERINLREENGLNAFCPRGVVNLQWMSAALS